MSREHTPPERPDPKQSRGAALVEYGMVAGLVVVASIGAVVATGDEVKTAFCSAANGLASAVHGKQIDECVIDKSRPVELEGGQRYVEATPEMVADFADKLYANSETGDRIVMSQVQGGSPASFWLDTEILSRDPYEPSRMISSCFLLGAEVDPICSAEGEVTSIEVPMAATAFGYMVSLSEDRVMPWANDVTISVPGNEVVAQQSWEIEVAREDAAPIREIAFDITDKLFAQTDTGWQSSDYAPITGNLNTSVWLVAAVDGPAHRRQLCYRMVSGGAETCGNPSVNGGSVASVELPAGAAEVALKVDFGDEVLGNDSIYPSEITVYESDKFNTALFSDTARMTRPNEPITRNISFDIEDRVFTETDTGWLSSDYAAITGERNVPIWLKASVEEGSYHRRQLCYRMETGGEEICSSVSYNHMTPVSVQLPVGASEVAVRVEFGDPVLGNDTSYKPTISALIAEDSTTAIFTDDALLTRPNEAISREISFDIEDRVFEQTDTGWLSSDYAAITGERNVAIWLTSTVEAGSYHYRQLCYRMEAGGEETCGSPSSTHMSKASVQLPVGASEVAVKVLFPDELIGNDTSYLPTIAARVTESSSGALHTDTALLTRPNEPKNFDIAFDIEDKTFAATDEDWQSSGYFPITGDRNVTVYLQAAKGGGRFKREICYRIETGGEETCAKSSTIDSPASIALPVAATEIAVKVNFGAATPGTERNYRPLVSAHKNSGLTQDLFEETVYMTRLGE